MTRERREEVVPSAARLLEALRDLGYDFAPAVADIIDNSIAADAGRVDVTISFGGDHSWVRVADDGTGMSGGVIAEAMRLGSERDYREDEMGRFGLGLKTASLSQARSLTVASRSREGGQLECRQLDLDDVKRRNRWEIFVPDAGDLPSEVVDPLQEAPGTVVIWRKLDRVLSHKDPFGEWAERHLLKLADELDLHLGMVFGRFLSGEAKRHKGLVIAVNGTPVEPWDPFCRKEGQTRHLPAEEIPLGGGIVRFTPYVLPSQGEFSDDAAWYRAGGPKRWNQQQGFYIYRADRLIQSGGWSWMRSPDEHTKLARAALEFWPDLDELFEINVSKMRVKLPEELRAQLTPAMSFLLRTAESGYREGRQPIPGGGGGGGDGKGKGAGGNRPPMADGGRALERAAHQVGLAAELSEIRTELLRSDPGIAHELGW